MVSIHLKRYLVGYLFVTIAKPYWYCKKNLSYGNVPKKDTTTIYQQLAILVILPKNSQKNY